MNPNNQGSCMTEQLIPCSRSKRITLRASITLLLTHQNYDFGFHADVASLTRIFNNIAIQGTSQMAVDKEAIPYLESTS